MTLTRKREPCIARNAKVALKSYKSPLRRTVSGQQRETTYDEENTVIGSESTRAAHQIITGPLHLPR